VDDLKLLPPDIFYELYKSEKFIVKEKARKAHKELRSQAYDFKKQAKKIDLTSEDPSDAVPPPPKKAKRTSHAMNKNNLGPDLRSFIPVLSVKTVKQVRAEREQRKRQNLAVQTRDIVAHKGDCSSLPRRKDPPETEITKEPRLALTCSDFRTERCLLSKDLRDPADENKKLCWRDAVNYCQDIQVDNLEDPDGLYSLLNASKTTRSDKEISEKFRLYRQGYLKLAATHHPDKVPDSDPSKSEKTKYFGV
jgi:hypothetical protein